MPQPSDDFNLQRIAKLEAELRRSELARKYAEDSSRRAWAMGSWVRRPAQSPPATNGRDEAQSPTP